MRVIAHFGAHKTGTSLIQKFMRDRPQLMSRNGIIAPGRSETGRMIGWGEARHLKAGGAELAAIADSAPKNTKFLIVSHEDTLNRPLLPGGNCLYPNARANAGRVHALFGDRPALAIHYIRSQPAFIESYYLQTIHEGAYHTFDEWFAPFAQADLSWRPLYDALTGVFGKENVVIRSFEHDMGQGQEIFLQNFFASFSSIRPGQMDGFRYAPLRNPSIGDRGLDIALAANRFLTAPAERKKMRKFLQQEFSNRDYPRPQLLPDGIRADMAARFRAENEALVAESAAATAEWRGR